MEYPGFASASGRPDDEASGKAKLKVGASDRAQALAASECGGIAPSCRSDACWMQSAVKWSAFMRASG
ncbi:MAG: hypothetical protein EBX72_02135, partial [Betaproteobacteria bacterium]|nr:hypothetical protein [Betaproteobacteria bacterium]